MSGTAERERVGAKINRHVLAFAKNHGTFHMNDLVQYVQGQVFNTAPDSPSRALRALRQKGRLKYIVVNARQSLYRVEWVK